MPRKQNGFGNSKSFAFKGAGRVDKGKGVGSFGFYPSNRQFGSSVHRTVIENWNLNSNWTKWRRGYELYNLAAFSRLNVANPDYNSGLPEDETNPAYVPAELKSLLYQGTPYEIDTRFRALEMPTMKSDVNTHYVVKRFIDEEDTGEADLGIITGQSNVKVNDQQKKYNEIWFKGTATTPRARLVLQMINERLTDGETEASLKNVLTRSQDLNLDIPAVYKGKSPTTFGVAETGLRETTVKIQLPIDGITIIENRKETRVINQGLSTYTIPASGFETLNDINQLIGKIVYIQDFFVDKDINSFENIDWIDYNQYFAVDVTDIQKDKQVIILDPGVSTLPPSMYDISTLPAILTAVDTTYTIQGSYAFLKEEYQRFFEKRYLTADVVKPEIDSASYSVFPFQILGAAVNGNVLELVSAPFTAEFKMYATINDPTLVFGDKSFVKYTTPSSARFTKAINTNVDPWQDEIFTSGGTLKPADIYTCDCPSYSKTLIAMPQASQNKDQRKINRQNRYPLPTALSGNRFENLGINKVAGKAASWASAADKNSFNYCKHTVTGMFVDGVQLIEPSQYPTQLERQLFEEKLEKELAKLDDAWKFSAERGGISLTEIVFSLAQGLNLDDVETGYVVLNSN